MREASSIVISEELKKLGAKVKAYDPKAMENAKKIISEIEFCENPYDVFKNSDAVLLVTEWDEFKKIDFSKAKSLMRGNLFIDGRNFFSKEEMVSFGFEYLSIGRP